MKLLKGRVQSAQLHKRLPRAGVVLLAVLLLCLALCAAAFAYYTYRGQYAGILTVNGEVRLDAFDVLYEDMRNQAGYGTTPENPFVIDNVSRWNNLIKLNNEGKLVSSKTASGATHYYFCLEFNTETMQLLDLADEGSFAPVGTVSYPFMDDLAGVVYAYNDATLGTVYYSGCIETVQITHVGSTVYVENDATALNPADYPAGTYYAVPHTYTKVNDKIVLDLTSTLTYIPQSQMTPVRQMIANETIALDASANAADNPVDVGVFGTIGASANVHDVILYNINISCTEDVTKLASVWSAVLDLFTGHNTVKDDDSDERHIGIFAGHVLGNVGNISVAGQSTIEIATAGVNYHSAYTTVGAFGDSATIGGIPVQELIEDFFTGNGNVGGCLFADAVYELVTTAGTSGERGATYYTLSNVQQNGKNLVKANQTFAMGSYTFLLSSSGNVISSIWPETVVNAIDNGNGTVTLSVLNDNTHAVNTCVLYCNDEYRYTGDEGSQSAVIGKAAAVSESKYTGVSNPDNSGSVIDAGKYLICARVQDDDVVGGYSYYAVKIKARLNNAGEAVYSFDDEDNDVTNYVMDQSGSKTLYMSALWEVENAATQAKFENCRFTGNWLGVNADKPSLCNSTAAVGLSYDLGNSAMYYTTTSGSTTLTHYLTFNPANNSFYFSETRGTYADIRLYAISNGYILREVTSTADLVENDQYIIAAEQGGTYTMLGLDTQTTSAGTTTISAQASAWNTDEAPASVTLNAYNANKNYVWLMGNVSGSTFTLVDRMSGTLYLAHDGSTAAGSASQQSIAYATAGSGCTLTMDGNTLTYNGTNFITGSAASGVTLHLYRLVPDVDDPLYITYAGSSMVDAQSSTLAAGDYVVTIKNGNDTYAVNRSGGAVSISPASVDNTTMATLRWTLTPTGGGATGDTFTLSYAGTTLSIGNNTIWRYDAVNHRFFTVDGSKYLGISGTSFALYNNDTQSGISFAATMYQVKTQYTYASFGLVDPSGTLSASKVYFIATAPIGDSTSIEAPVLAGRTDASTNGSALSYYNIGGKYTVSGTVSNRTATFVTTYDISNYVWNYERSSSQGSYDDDNQFYNGTGSRKLYLGISATTGSRTLQLNSASQRSINGSIVAATTFNLYSSHTYWFQDYYYSAYGGMICFHGSLQYNFLHLGSNPGTLDLVVRGDNGCYVTDMPYVYEAGSMTTTEVLSAVSDTGDTLVQDFDYMIAAAFGTGDETRYAALSRNDEGTLTMGGTDVTAQVQQSLTNPGASVMVPVGAAWTQTSDSAELRFAHVATANSGSANYLIPNGTSAVTTQNVASNVTNNTATWHYDIVGKRLSTIINSTTYYLAATKNGETVSWSLTTNIANAARIYLIHVEATYRVDRVDDWGSDTLQSGEFVIAGTSAAGATGLGSTGNEIVWQSMSGYLTTNLSEANYMAIQNYIWLQKYYDNNTSITYATDITDNEITFQPANKAGLGGVAGLYRSGGLFSSSGYVLQPYSGDYRWDLTKTNTGNWTLINADKVGNSTFGTSAGQVGLIFTDESSSTLNAQQAGVIYEKTSTGELDNSVNWGTDSSNIYLYNSVSFQPISTISTEAYYFLVAVVNSKTYAIGNYSGNIAVIEASSADGLDNHFKWRLSSFSGGYRLYNAEDNTTYANVDAEGELYLGEADPIGYFTRSGALLKYAYLVGDTYYAYRYSSSSVRLNTSTSYYAQLYYVSNVETRTYIWGEEYYRYTLTKTSSSNNTVDGSNRWLLLNSTSRYYLVGHSGSSFTIINIGTPNSSNGGNLVFDFDDNVSEYTAYNLQVTKVGSKYSLKFSDTNLYYLTPPTSISSSKVITLSTTQSVFGYNDSNGLNVSTVSPGTFGISSISNGFSIVPANGNTMVGGTTIVFRKNGSTWSPYYGSLNTGDTYAIAVRKMPTDENHPGNNTASYYLMGYNGSSLISYDLGATTDDAATFLSGNTNYHLVAIDGNNNIGKQLVYVNTMTSESNYRYLAVSDTGYLTASSTMPTTYDWRYEGNDTLTYKSRLWTVTKDEGNTSYSVDVVTNAETGNYFTAVTNDPGTTGLLYPATSAGNDTYNVSTSQPATSVSSGQTYVFAVVKGGAYYLACRDSTATDIVQAVDQGSGVPATVSAAYVWSAATINNRFSLYGVDGSGRQLCINTSDGSRLYVPASAKDCYWTYKAELGTARFDATSAANATELSLYKVTKNTDFDAVTDVATRLNGKAQITPSLSVASAGYLLVAQVAGDSSTSYYSLAVSSPETAVTLDITDIFTDTLAGDNITVFDASVWDQLGSDYRLIFDNNGFDGSDLYLMTGSHTTSAAQPCLVTVSDLGGDISAYTWNLHTQSTGYLLGYSDASHGTPVETYLYFDASSLTFKLTTDIAIAQAGTQVTMYQLHNEIEDIVYQTFSIGMASDGVTVESLPLVKANPHEITTFGGDDSALSGIIDHRIDGEYMIMAVLDGTYYTLTYNAENELTFVDVSLLFAGNKSLMQYDANVPAQYCLSVNNRYIWQQTGTLTTSTDMTNGISLHNVGCDRTLSLGGVTEGLSYNGQQLFATSGGSAYYLNFTANGGYAVTMGTSSVPITLYAVGISGNATGGSHSHGGGQYVYFEEGLPTSGADYSNFSHEITTISDLKQYMMTYAGVIDWEAGWSLEDGSKMDNADYSIYFEGGIDFDASNFASTFVQVGSSYNKRDITTGNRTEDVLNVSYYAPEGGIVVLIPYATESHPVFVNVIATTEQAVDKYDETLRWLALWKAADLNAESGTLTVNGKTSDITAADYATVLKRTRNTPYAAIPLPNSTGSVASGASAVYLAGEMAPHYLPTLQATAGGQTFNSGWDHLIAHTFEINEPGLYYIGSTAGSVAYSYVSVYDKYLAIGAEDGTISVSDDFTLDFVWGTYNADCTAASDFGADTALGSVCYVGKTGTEESDTWRHSNIQPEFVDGTAGLYTGSMPDVYDPVDDLTIEVYRVIDPGTGVSTVTIQLSGDDGTATSGYLGAGQVKIINSNSAYERNKNKYQLTYAN